MAVADELAWLPHLPDGVRRPRRLSPAVVAAPVSLPTSVAPPFFAACFPDRIPPRRRLQLPALHAASLWRLAVHPLVWLPHFPDRTARRRRLLAQASAIEIGWLTTIPQRLSSWRPVFPTGLRRRRPIAAGFSSGFLADASILIGGVPAILLANETVAVARLSSETVDAAGFSAETVDVADLDDRQLLPSP